MKKAKTLSISMGLDDRCSEVGRILKVLAHPERLRILSRLLDGEKTVSELENCCQVSQSQLSQFLGRMRLEGLLDSRKDGQRVYYFIKDSRILELLSSLYQIYCGSKF